MAIGFIKRLRGHWLGITAFVLLAAIGLVNLASADFYSQDSFHRSQLVWTLVGLLVGAALYFMDLRIIERNAYAFYWIVTGLLVATRFVGTEINNSKRWIVVGNQQMQPSEFLKFALVLALARLVHFNKGPEPYNLRTLVKPSLLILGPAALVVVQPDLGTTLVILAMGGTMLLYEGVRPRTVGFLLGLLLLAVPVAWELDLVHGYQKDRVQLWLNAEKLDPRNPDHKRILDKNLQTEQALWAIGSGRVFGKGIHGGAESRLKYLPEMQNDFILATFGEEHGFAGCAALTALYWVLVVWALGVARRARERFCSQIAAGFAAMIFWHFFVNVGMVTGLLPVVGLPLPLMSQGGSSALTTFALFGLVLNAATSRVKIGL